MGLVSWIKERWEAMLRRQYVRDVFGVIPRLSADMEEAVRNFYNITAGQPKWLSDDVKTINFASFIDDVTAGLTVLDLKITVDGHSLKIFRDDEASHMKDVKNVFGEGIILTLVSILVCIAYLFFLFNRPKEYYETSRKVPFITLGVLIGIFLAVALYTIIDYKYVFEVLLHNALFSGNFSFSNGVMISMIGEIFPDLFMLIGIGWAVSLAVPVLAFVFYNRHLKKKLAQNEAKKTEKTETTTAN